MAGESMSFGTSSGPAAKAELSVFSLAEAAAEKLGGGDAIGFRVVSDADMASAVELGFSVNVVDALRKGGVTDKEIGALIIKPRTLSHRREKRQKLTVEESDRAARVARILALADKTFVNKDKAGRWLHKDLSSLDGRRPIDLVRTAAGARIVEDVLTRIAWGAAA
jgi:putative toxin-antitoxin system antitoxin component (TIGR02293 family)